MTRVVICVDGLEPAYLAAAETPGWDAIAASGAAGECEGVVPSVTNVNNVSIVTGAFPAEHGITANTYYDREADERVYMEDPSFLRAPTRLETAADAGDTVGSLVVKDKLRRMVGRGCDVSESAEDAPAWLEDAVGPAPDIYSGDASPWMMDAAVHVLEARDLDWLYVSTTDVVPHKHGPEEEPARRWVAAMDDGIAAVAERATAVAVTADHGMARKTLAVDVERSLGEAGIDATVIRLIRDKHVYHHQNLGGAAYVYVHDGSPDAAADHLESVEGVDLVLSREAACERFRLPADRVGDLMLLGTPRSAFGPLEEGTHAEVDLRSHGSHHERTVPYVTSNGAEMDANVDAFDAIAE